MIKAIGRNWLTVLVLVIFAALGGQPGPAHRAAWVRRCPSSMPARTDGRTKQIQHRLTDEVQVRQPTKEQSGQRLIAMGDIHGCIHALDAILAAITPVGDDTIVVLGDFIDQGRNTREVIDRLLSLEHTNLLVCLKGNHEEMLLAATKCDSTRRYWETAGGVATLYSYRFGGTIHDIPDEHIQFIARCRDYYETERFIFVHANFDPDLSMPSQLSQTLRWQVLEPDARRHHSGKTVICGHSEQVDGEIFGLDGIKCIDTACWHYGWLTALEVNTGQVWQASRFGVLRSDQQTPVGRIPGSA